MSDTLRAALAAADDVVTRVRARLGELPVPLDGDAATAARIADEWERHALSLQAEAKLAESVRNFRQRWPALVKWRERVLSNRRKARPSDVAAALESLALECTLAGEHHLAVKAQHQAIQVMRAIAPIRSSGASDPSDAREALSA